LLEFIRIWLDIRALPLKGMVRILQQKPQKAKKPYILPKIAIPYG
jgi:hypothetical protein